MTNFQRDLVFKRAFLKRTTQILFPIVVNSVYDHLLPYLTVKTVKFLVHIFYEHPQKTISLPDVCNWNIWTLFGLEIEYLEAEALKLWCYVPSTFFDDAIIPSPMEVTNVLCFLRFLNGNWNRKTAWQIQTALAVIECLHQSSLWFVNIIRILYHWKILFHYFFYYIITF